MPPTCGSAQISSALSPYLRGFRSHLTLALGVAGVALLAGIVVSLAAARALAEAFCSRRSLNDTPRNAPLFYGIYTICVISGAAVVLASRSLLRVAVVGVGWALLTVMPA